MLCVVGFVVIRRDRSKRPKPLAAVDGTHAEAGGNELKEMYVGTARHKAESTFPQVRTGSHALTFGGKFLLP